MDKDQLRAALESDLAELRNRVSGAVGDLTEALGAFERSLVTAVDGLDEVVQGASVQEARFDLHVTVEEEPKRTKAPGKENFTGRFRVTNEGNKPSPAFYTMYGTIPPNAINPAWNPEVIKAVTGRTGRFLLPGESIVLTHTWTFLLGQKGTRWALCCRVCADREQTVLTGEELDVADDWTSVEVTI